MKPWTINRRGYTLCTFSCMVLLLILITTVFFPPYGSRLPTSLQSKPEQESAETRKIWKLPPMDQRIPINASMSLTPEDEYSGFHDNWTFDTDRDERNFHLSPKQCSIAFPKFYYEIERAVKYRILKGLGRITEQDVDITWREGGGEILRAMIYDKQLYIIDVEWADHGYDVPRAIAILHSINRAVISYPGKLPNIEFALNLSDWPLDPDHRWPLWVFTRHEEDPEKWVVPDFGYWSWPESFMGEYSELRHEIRENEPSWQHKFPKAVWRGAIATNELREELLKKSKNKPWADIKSITWDDKANLKKIGLTIPQHCNYKFVVHTEGHSYSGRGKYLLNCQSVSIVHTPMWLEPHTHLFISEGPNQNIVAVDRNFTNLDSAMKDLLTSPRKAQRIARNSVQTFRDRYLTPAAQACYWRRLFYVWSQISFEPKLFHDVKDQNGQRRRKVRGKPFESFVSEFTLPVKAES
ncbi:DUF821 domain-containing protein [Microthyrium microscopicum]|uniref:DUF821 domain-containing protein n=1 Tax=Microthyrium microscopicum TaxID=703497 RepID=A0A6A6UV34_9PEZI|nr:DUF821 domain-containing protein [Microthyrium microscopicum]